MLAFWGSGVLPSPPSVGTLDRNIVHSDGAIVIVQHATEASDLTGG